MVDYHFNFFKKYLTDPIFVNSIVYIFELSSFGGFPSQILMYGIHLMHLIRTSSN